MAQTKQAKNKAATTRKPARKPRAKVVEAVTESVAEPLNAEGLTEVECTVLGLAFTPVGGEGQDAAQEQPSVEAPTESAVRDATAEEVEAARLGAVEAARGLGTPVGKPWLDLPEVGLNRGGQRDPNWVDPVDLAELQAVTEATYAVAIAKLADATEAIDAAARMHARTKSKVRVLMRAGGSVTFIRDLPPDIGRRVAADHTGELGTALRKTSSAMNAW